MTKPETAGTSIFITTPTPYTDHLVLDYAHECIESNTRPSENQIKLAS